MKIFALIVALALAAPLQAQAPSPHATEIPRWFTETFLEMPSDVRGTYHKEPSFQRYLQARTERLRGRGDKPDLWN